MGSGPGSGAGTGTGVGLGWGVVVGAGCGDGGVTCSDAARADVDTGGAVCAMPEILVGISACRTIAIRSFIRMMGLRTMKPKMPKGPATQRDTITDAANRHGIAALGLITHPRQLRV